MNSARLCLLTLFSTLVACGPSEDPGSSATQATSTTTSGGSSATTMAVTPTTTQAETTQAATTDGGGTDSDSAGEICGDGGQVRWIRQFDAASDTGYNGLSLAVDGAGNVVLVGQFAIAANFGGETFVPVGQGPDSFVAKFDTEGHHVWSRHIGGPGEQRIDAVAVDDDGTIALGGRFGGSIDLGGGPLLAASLLDVVVANLTADGEHVWSRAFTSLDMFTTSLVSDVAIADGATVFIAEMHDSSDFGGGPIGLIDSNNSFTVKLDASGAHVWSRAMGSGGPWSFQSTTVTIDVAGDVWVAGRFDNEANFGDGPPVPVAQTSLFTVRRTADGELLDVLVTSTLAGGHAPYASVLGADANGRVYVGGSFSGELGFGGEPLVGSGGLDGFVVTLNGDGAPLRRQVFGQGAEDNQAVHELAVDAAGRTAIVGDFASGIDFGNGVLLTGNPFVDGYVAKLDVDGAPLWARAFGAEQWGNGAEVGIDDLGAVYVAGIFRDTLAIDDHTLEMANEYDTVLMKLCP